MIYNYQEYSAQSSADMNQERDCQEHEQVWGDMRENEEERPPQEALLSARFDSITSTTLFVNPNEIQPVNPNSYSGAPILRSQPVQAGPSLARGHVSQQVQAGPSLARGHEIQATTSLSEQIQGGSSTLAARTQQVSLSLNPGIQVRRPEHFAEIQVSGCDDNVLKDIEQGRRRLSVTESGEVLIEDVDTNRTYSRQDEIMETASNQSTFIDESTNHSTQSSMKQENHQNFFILNPVEVAGHSRQPDSEAGFFATDTKPSQFFGHKGLVSLEPSPCGVDISTRDFLGEFDFDVSFTESSNTAKNKHWEYSKELKKLYIGYNKWVQVEFRVGRQPPPQLKIRTLPVFSEPASQREPVKRCPNHANYTHSSNEDFSFTEHLIRYQNEDTQYEENLESQRLYTLFNVGTPHQGTDVCTRMMKFMCLGSDIGGINRRPIKIVFTLEFEDRVVGRKVVDVRICSCPRRDLQQEEQRHREHLAKVRGIAQKFANTTSIPPKVSLLPPPGKKRKMDNVKIIMVPVHHDDFRKINEFAEGAWVCRDPGNADTIRETRMRLLQKHNSEHLKKIDQKK